MKPFTTHTGQAMPLFMPNIDTDQIVPKKFLLKIERTGFDEALFYDWRNNADGSLTTDFVLNDPRYKGASILLVGKNFGCGSSREHAPWALLEYGFRVVIASAFADIFYNNSLKTGLLPVRIDERRVAELVERATTIDDYSITVDLVTQLVSDTCGFSERFEIDEFRRNCLLNGLDEIGLTLQHEADISQYENTHTFRPIST